jgi:hypothetical protein
VTPRREFAWSAFIAAVLVCATVASSQISRSAYRGSLADHPDEAAHFVSGLCVLDYLRTGLGTNPIKFAESYYAHYPKVAVGHWPPMFFLIQAALYGLAGESVFNAILLAGIVAALTAWILFLRLNRLYGIVVALLATAMFLWLPLVRAGELVLMADMLASLFSLLAVFAVCDACIREQHRYWLLAGLWSAFAVFTKESALTLVLIIPAAVICLRRVLRSTKASRVAVVGSASLVSVLLVLYAACRFFMIRKGPWLSTSPSRQGMEVLTSFAAGASLVMFLIVAVTIVGIAKVDASRSNDRRVHTVAALIWLIGALVSQVFIRDAFEPRYLLPAYVAATLLAAEGLFVIQGMFRRPAVAALGIVFLTGLCVFSTPALRMHQRTGYEEIAAAVPHESEGQVVLVSSDARGEGAMVAQLLLEDAGRTDVVLRGTKALSTSDWMGRDYKLLAQSPASVMELLNSVPVHFVVVDMNGFIEENTRPHHRLLEESIRNNRAQFQLIGDHPLYFDGHRRGHAVQIYENLNARGRRAQSIHINMAYSLGRDLDVQLTPAIRRTPRSATRVATGTAPGVPATSFSIAPQSDHVPARGGAGRIYVTAPSAYSWSLHDVPEWIHIDHGAGKGDGIIAYEVAENRTNHLRSATLAVADAPFAVTQPRSAITYVAFFEDFAEPIRTPEPPDWNSTLDPPSQWVLNDQSGQGAKMLQTGQVGDSARNLVLDKPGRETESWKTQITLPHIEIPPNAQYRVTIRLKAEHSAPVWLTLQQGNPSGKGCGFSEALPVTTVWSDFDVIYRAKEDCAEAENRLVLEAGKIVGRLWIANLRFTELPQRGAQ